jgi:hypothetical protein
MKRNAKNDRDEQSGESRLDPEWYLTHIRAGQIHAPISDDIEGNLYAGVSRTDNQYRTVAQRK